MQTYRTEGLILHALKFQDHDHILTIFTPGDGLLKMIVKGAFRSKQSPGAVTAPLTQAEFVYARGKSELLPCREISLLNQHLALRATIDRLESAFDLIHTVMASQMPYKPAPDLYKLLIYYLEKMPSPVDPHILAASFRLKVLRHDGHLGQYDRCIQCQSANPMVYFAKGETFCRAHAPPEALEFTAEEVALLHLLAYAKTFGELASERLSPAFRHKVKLLFQDALA